MSTATEGIPRTANLLACKQWWKVCFLYGDQEKYYRQIYGKAASQRLALSNQQCDTQSNVTDTSDDKKQQAVSPTLFPLKQPSRRRSKIQPSINRGESIKANSKVTVLDDPFLFGLNEQHANLSEDSGIDNTAFENPTTTTTNNVRRHSTKLYSERELCNDLKINADDLKNLHLSRNRNGLCHQINQSFSFSEVNVDVNEKVDGIKGTNQDGLNHVSDDFVALNDTTN